MDLTERQFSALISRVTANDVCGGLKRGRRPCSFETSVIHMMEVKSERG